MKSCFYRITWQVIIVVVVVWLRFGFGFEFIIDDDDEEEEEKKRNVITMLTTMMMMMRREEEYFNSFSVARVWINIIKNLLIKATHLNTTHLFARSYWLTFAHEHTIRLLLLFSFLLLLLRSIALLAARLASEM